MSNTFKTKPLWVKMASKDPDTRKHVGIQESHDHRTGEPCDLPDRPEILNEEGNRTFANTTRCHWDWVYVGVNLCGCKMCTQQDARKANTKAARRAETDDYHLLTRSLRGVDLTDEEAVLEATGVVDARYKVPDIW